MKRKNFLKMIGTILAVPIIGVPKFEITAKVELPFTLADWNNARKIMSNNRPSLDHEIQKMFTEAIQKKIEDDIVGLFEYET